MNNPLRLVLLFVPSVIFVGVLLFIFMNKQADQGIAEKITKSPLSTTPTPTPEPLTTVTIKEDIVVLAQVADSDEERRIGLSQTGFLAENEGLLFDFQFQEGDNRRPQFWMKGMSIPIDIIWIADEKIAQIHKNVEPPEENAADSNLKLYVPNDPIDYVLEVNAGFSDNNNLQIGDSVDF